MDLDLFEDCDDEILSCIPIDDCDSRQNENQISNENHVVFTPEFNCKGEDSVRCTEFPQDTFLKNIFKDNFFNYEMKSVDIAPYSISIETIKLVPSVENFVFNQLRMNVQIFLASLGNNKMEPTTSFYEKRQQITNIFYLVSSSQNPEVLQKLEMKISSFRNFLKSILTEKYLKMIYLATSTRGNELHCASYHLLHGLLEWRILDLLLIEKSLQTDLEENSVLLSQCKQFLSDLFYISIQYFKKREEYDLLSASPFPCGCVKECWVILMILYDKIGQNFWTVFNDIASQFENDLNKHDMKILNFIICKMWIFKGLSSLENYKIQNIRMHFINVNTISEDNSLMKTTLSTFFKLEPSEEQCRTLLRLVMSVVLVWWKPTSEIPMIFWEYFHKKLNSNFIVPGAVLSEMGVSSSTGRGYLDKVSERLRVSEDLLQGIQSGDVDSTRKNSFYLFTQTIGITIRKLMLLGQCNQINKMIGRIFSKFSSAKLASLSECGLHNLIELFLSIAISSEQSDVIVKLRDKILAINLTQTSVPRQTAIVKGHVAFMILFANHQIDMAEYVNKLSEQISGLKPNENQPILRILAGGLHDIFVACNSLDLGQYALIDSWLSNYLQFSSPSDQDRIYEFLHFVFEKNDVKDMNNLKNSMNLNILPFVKQQFCTSFSTWLPQVAADFCLSINPNEKSILEKNVRFFTESNCVTKDYLIKFVLILLESRKDILNATAVIGIWLKSLVCLSATNEEVVNLSRYVVELAEFKTVCGGFEKDMLSSKEPLCTFISAIGKNYNSCTTFQNRREIADKFNLYVNSFEKWIQEKTEKHEVLLRFYSFIAIVIYNCATIVYEKAKVTCFFHVAMTRYILPATVQMGKSCDPKIIQIIHKIWAVVVQGIGLLNFKSDSYITKTLVDMIQKWTPLFKISNNTKLVSKPFITLIKGDNPPLLMFTFEKLTSMFLTAQRRQSGPHSCLIVTIFQEIVESVCDEETKLGMLLKATCFSTLEHVLLVDDIVPSKKLIVQLFEKIVRCNAFKTSFELRNLLLEQLKTLMVKHLGYNTFYYFDLLEIFANIDLKIVMDLMGFLQEQITVLENKRGGGPDNRLRTCLDKFKTSVNNKSI